MEIGARLHHLLLRAADPQACADFYGRTFAMEVQREGDQFVCSGPERQLIFTGGPAHGLGHGAFAFPSATLLGAYRRRVEARLGPRAAAPSCGLSQAFEVTDPDGNRIVFGAPAGTPAGAPARAPTGAPARVPAGASARVPPEEPERTPPAVAAREPRASPPPTPARLQHFAVRSRDPARLRAFYRDTLEFVVSDSVYTDDGDLRACFLRSDREHHAIAVFHADHSCHDHLSFETTDWNAVRDWADRVAAVGVPIVWGVGRHGPGNDTFFMVRDPDGNLAEISAELEVCEPGRTEGRWRHEQRTLNQWGAAIMRS